MTVMYVLLAAAIGVGLYVIVTFNSLVSLRTRVNEAWSDIRVQMKRRYDLIPGLVETVKSYAAHEATTLRQVVEARNVAMSDDGSPESQARSENMLQHALKNLFALAEAYPDLKASGNFAQLQADLTDTENKLKMSRRFYNGSVRELNIKVEQFPSNIVARMFGFRQAQFFDLDEGEAAAEQPVPIRLQPS